MSLIRPRRVAAAFAVAAISVFGMQGTASADGHVTWTNVATGWKLQSNGAIDRVNNGSSLFTDPTDTCGIYGMSDWYDLRQSDGSWVEKNLFDAESYGYDVCLDGNAAYGGGTYGSAYAHTCIATNSNPDLYQHWTRSARSATGEEELS